MPDLVLRSGCVVDSDAWPNIFCAIASDAPAFKVSRITNTLRNARPRSRVGRRAAPLVRCYTLVATCAALRPAATAKKLSAKRSYVPSGFMRTTMEKVN